MELAVPGIVTRVPKTVLKAGQGAVGKLGDRLGIDKLNLSGFGKLDGVAANRRITAAYDQLDQELAAYLGTVEVANWTTFGKYASLAAGEGIRKAEQALSLNPLELGKLVLQSPAQLVAMLGEQAAPLLGLALDKSKVKGVPTPTAVVHGVNALKTLRDGLVAANKGVYDDIGSLLGDFLQAERAGRDGVAEAAAKVAAGTLADPSGLLVEALELYRQAARDPARRAALIGQANTLLVLHEQFYVVQPVFGDAKFARVAGAIGDTLAIKDANGKFPLLTANQGAWTDFETRMGLRRLGALEGPQAFAGHRNGEVGNQVFRLVGPDGKPRFYTLAPAAKLPGTILDYFARRSTGTAAERNHTQLKAL